MDLAQLTRLFVAWHMHLRQEGRRGTGKLVAAHFVLVETDAEMNMCVESDTSETHSFFQFENLMFFATDDVISTPGMVVAEADANGGLVVVSGDEAPPAA